MKLRFQASAGSEEKNQGASEKINECMVQAANANAKVKQVNKFSAYAKYKCKKKKSANTNE